MKLFPTIVAGCLLATAASAQSTSPANPSSPGMMAAPGTATAPAPGTGTSMGTETGTGTGSMMKSGMTDPKAGVDAASGNTNQAVVTTDANAMQPAKGSNSFTAGEAQRRIEAQGYATVADLKKDDDGIWRGHGTKDGASTGVWLDYKGNIGRM